jgi:hypothetical protein
MTTIVFLTCLLAAVLAVGIAAALDALIPTMPGWLVDVIKLTVLLVAFVWLGALL